MMQRKAILVRVVMMRGWIKAGSSPGVPARLGMTSLKLGT